MVNVPDRLRRLRINWQHPDLRQPTRRARFGNLRRVAPISRAFGKDRGLPIDRYYIEQFLADQAPDIRGMSWRSAMIRILRPSEVTALPSAMYFM